MLPAQASSVPCERLFSGTKQVATDRRASLGSEVFEELVIMRSAWGPDLCNMAEWNKAQVEEIPMLEFEDMLVDDAEHSAWERESYHTDSEWVWPVV